MVTGGYGTRGLLATLACALGLICCAQAVAAPADLDRSFGGDGSVRVEGFSGAPFPSAGAARMAVGPDDEVYVLYSSASRCAALFDCEIDLSVLRYDSSGHRDPSYGAGPGSQWTVPWSGIEVSLDFAVGSDGKAVAAAVGRVARFDQAGHLDGTFGQGGEVVISEWGGWLAVAIQADGSVLVADERGRSESGPELRLLRYLSNGEPDHSFDGDGEAVVTSSTGTCPAGIMLGPTGDISVATPRGCGSRPFGNGFSLARFLADGRLDTAFDGDGQLLFPTPEAQASVEATALAPDGGTFVVFEEDMESRFTVGNVVKLLPGGALDETFGTRGRLQLHTRGYETTPDDLVVDPRGRPIVVGSSGPLSVIRLRPEGSNDRTFNGGLPVSLRIHGFVAGAVMAGLQSNGRIVILGESERSARKLFELFALRGGTDRTRCQDRRATIVGTHRADELTGTPRRDVIAALDGNDQVRGLSGADLICGGQGHDRLLGGPGRDSVQQQPRSEPVVR